MINTIHKRLKIYQKPVLKKIGSITKITLKGGSQPDFGGNFYQP